MFSLSAAAEKFLKAFLVYNDQEPPKTHDLTELLKLCKKFDDNFNVINLQCEFLFPYAVRIRYPGGVDPEENDMRIALRYTNDIINFVKSKIVTGDSPS